MFYNQLAVVNPLKVWATCSKAFYELSIVDDEGFRRIILDPTLAEFYVHGAIF